MTAQCEGTTRNGQRCRGKAMHGHALCGPHADGTSLPRKPKPKAKPVGKTMPCSLCGLAVPIAGKLVSYHEPINGCRAVNLKGDVR